MAHVPVQCELGTGNVTTESNIVVWFQCIQTHIGEDCYTGRMVGRCQSREACRTSMRRQHDGVLPSGLPVRCTVSVSQASAAFNYNLKGDAQEFLFVW